MIRTAERSDSAKLLFDPFMIKKPKMQIQSTTLVSEQRSTRSELKGLTLMK